MAMVTLYCDDSGTHAESPFAVAGCFVAPVLQWDHFTKDWQRANDAEGFGVFHMADFVAKKKQFAAPEWQDEDKRARTIKRLVNIVNTRRQVGFVTVVDKAGYDSEVSRAMREKFKLGNNHYSFAVRMSMAKVLKWRMKYKYTEPIQFVFDQLTKGKGEIDAIFEDALEEGDEQALVHGISRDAGWSFQNKAIVLPLQGADILAWEGLYYMKNSYVSGAKMRKSFKTLLDGPVQEGLHDGNSLRKWVAHVRERTGEHW